MPSDSSGVRISLQEVTPKLLQPELPSLEKAAHRILQEHILRKNLKKINTFVSKIANNAVMSCMHQAALAKTVEMFSKIKHVNLRESGYKVIRHNHCLE